MRPRFRYFLLVLLLTALAATSCTYRSSTVQERTGRTEVLRTRSRPAHPAQLAHAAPLAAPAQQAPRGFFPPGELPGIVLAPVPAYTAPMPCTGRQQSCAGKRYLDHNYPYHAFW